MNYSSHKKQNWWPALVLMALLTIGALIRDIWMIVHHMSFGGGIPLLLPISLFAMLAIVWTIKRHDDREP